MWDKMQWGVFLIFTGFLIPLGIVFIVMARHENKSIINKVDDWEDRTFINSYNLKDGYEQRYY
jgi:hypothetical protein